MLISAHIFRFPGGLLALFGLLCGLPCLSQPTVGMLRAEHTGYALPSGLTPVASDAGQFEFDRNLIFIRAEINGGSGNFILDTGAPTLVVNHRGAPASTSASYSGLGAGGSVQLNDQRIDHFAMGGREMENTWAIGLDLRPMEKRTQHRIDGLVGYEMLKSGELRIDFSAGSYQLLASRRRPEHFGRQPDHVIRFSYIDHLPVIRVRVGRRRLYFALDTGAGVNLIDCSLAAEGVTEANGGHVNVQGIDGLEAEYQRVGIGGITSLPASDDPVEFVSIDLSHLQTPGSPRISGILGSQWLSRYTVGIDYRRRKLYLW